MRRLLLLAFVLLLAPATVHAQDNGNNEWTFDGIFPADSGAVVHGGRGGFGANGATVDPAGKLWVGGFYNDTYFVTDEGDSIATTGIYVFNPDGTETDFSPITSITVDGVQDTLVYTSDGFPYSTRDMTTDQNGNVIFTSSGFVYRINYKTGEGMKKFVGPRDDEGGIISIADAVVATAPTAQGSIFLSHVAGGNPIGIYSTAFEELGQVTDSRTGFSRSGAVNNDGTAYYQNMFTQDMTVKYTSKAGPFGTYSKVDTVLKGMAAITSTFNDATGNLWANAGTAGEAPNEYVIPGSSGEILKTSWDRYTLYGYNPESGEVVDSVRWNNADVDEPKARDIAFTASGDTMYVVNFVPAGPGVQRFVRTGQSAVERPSGTPDGLTLSDNAPNPFQQSTKLRFSLDKPSHVTLVVYDVLGRRVSTLVDDQMTAGAEHTVRFEADGLPSGVYFYRLQAGGHQLTGKMVLAR